MPRRKDWHERIKALALKEGGLEKLAVDLGVSFFTVIRWRDGIHKPSRLAQHRIKEFEKEVIKK